MWCGEVCVKDESSRGMEMMKKRCLVKAKLKCPGIYSRAPIVINLAVMLDAVPQAVPTEFAVGSAYPNPFNSVVRIEYDIPKIAEVEIKVYSLLGQEVETLLESRKQPGRYSLSFDAQSLTSGMYFISMNSTDFQAVRKILLLK